MPQTLLQLTLPTRKGKAIPVDEFLVAVSTFRGIYRDAVKQMYDSVGSPNVELSKNRLRQQARKLAIKYKNDAQVERLSYEGMLPLRGRDDLFLQLIYRTNPIEAALLGLAYPLAIAVVLSGGKLQMGPLKVKLPTLGHGVLALRKAFRPSKPKRVEPRRADTGSQRIQKSRATKSRVGLERKKLWDTIMNLRKRKAATVKPPLKKAFARG